MNWLNVVLFELKISQTAPTYLYTYFFGLVEQLTRAR